MGLYEDLQELSLLVPDAPTLPGKVLDEAHDHAEAVAQLLIDASNWADDTDALVRGLAVALGELRNRCSQAQEVVRAGIDAVTEVMRDFLTGLDRNEDGVEKALARAVAQFDEIAKDFASFTQAVSTVGEVISPAVDGFSSGLGAQVSALQASATAAARAAASTGAQVSNASTAAQDSAAQIASRMERVGAVGWEHALESAEAVKKHLAAVGGALKGVTDALEPAWGEMAATATATEEKAGALVAELEGVMGAARKAAETLEPVEAWLSTEGTRLDDDAEALRGRRVELTTLVDNARAAAPHVGQGR